MGGGQRLTQKGPFRVSNVSDVLLQSRPAPWTAGSFVLVTSFSLRFTLGYQCSINTAWHRGWKKADYSPGEP